MRQHAENLRSTLVPKPAKWCPGRDLNPHFPCEKKDFKSFASADFATRALPLYDNRRATFSLDRNASAMMVSVGF
jgi:hypothetical protein